MRWPRILALLLAVCAVSARAAQQPSPPVIQWQQSFGGTNYDYNGLIRQLPDGGYVLAGISASPPGGNKSSEFLGVEDIWLVRLDASGNKLWDRTYGGDDLDGVLDLVVLPNGELVLCAATSSTTNANKHAPQFGSSDYWMLKLDGDGNRVWDMSYGGSGYELPRGIAVTGDGGFMLVGESRSPVSGNKTAPSLLTDYWIVGTDSQGNMLWDRSYGGTFVDNCNSVSMAADGGIVLCGQSSSIEGGTKTSPDLGNGDAWLVRLDSVGNQLWDRTYGGSGHELYSRAKVLPDGGIILIATSSSYPGSIKTSPYYGATQSMLDGDFWILRLDANGVRLWDRSFGGTGSDTSLDVHVTTDGGFIICGASFSGVDGNKTSPLFGGTDGWVTRLDASGNLVWQMSLGGTQWERITSVVQTRDGGFVLAGTSASGADGNKSSPNLGSSDLWVIKLGPDMLTAPQVSAVAQSAESIRAIGFRLEVQPPPNAPTSAVYIVEASTNMTAWEAIQTNQLATGATSIEFADSTATNRTSRFYRVKMER